MVEVDLRAAQAGRLADAQAVAEHHQHQEMVAGAVASRLGGLQQRADLGPAEEVLAPLMRVGGRVRGMADG